MFSGKLTEAALTLGIHDKDAPGYDMCVLIDNATTAMNIKGTE
jgi:hypothetical protein